MRFVKPSEIRKANEEVTLRMLGETPEPPPAYWDDDKRVRHVVCLSVFGECPFCAPFKDKK